MSVLCPQSGTLFKLHTSKGQSSRQSKKKKNSQVSEKHFIKNCLDRSGPNCSIPQISSDTCWLLNIAWFLVDAMMNDHWLVFCICVWVWVRRFEGRVRVLLRGTTEPIGWIVSFPTRVRKVETLSKQQIKRQITWRNRILSTCLAG